MKELEAHTPIHTYFTAHTPNVSPVLEAERNCFLAVFEKRVKKKALFSGRSPLLTRASLTDEGGKSPARTRRLVSCSGMMSFLFSLLACHWSSGLLQGRGV